MSENAPRSMEGAAALSAIMQPGAWRRAGMAGVVTGIDAEAALARVPLARVDRDIALRLVAAGEAGLIAGAAKASGRRGDDFDAADA